MAAETLANIFNALSQIMDGDLTRQWNRATYLLKWIAAAGGIKAGSGKNAAFDVEFTGATGGTVAEGSDVAATEYNSDVNEPAIFPWATYRTSFQISEQEVDAARTSIGTPDKLRDLFGSRIISANAFLAKSVEQDLLTGTGVDTNGNPTLIGIFGGALSASGIYGGLNPATYTEWASTLLANGGTLRSLTINLMNQADNAIFIAASLPWNLIVTSAGVAAKYEQFFTAGTGNTGGVPMTRMNDNVQDPGYGMGAALNDIGQMDNLLWKGKRVQRNPLSPTGKVAFLNTEYIRMQYLPHMPTRNEIEFFDSIGLTGSSGDEPSTRMTVPLPVRFVELAKTGDSHKISARVTIAAALLRRNAMAVVQDISEA
jgi:hypothetical protein